MIYTNHCLECIPTLTTQVIKEICRVSRGHVVLFEPSYQLGSAGQKLKMIINNYPLYFPKCIDHVDHTTLEEPFLLQNCLKPLNRTGCYRIIIDKTGQPINEPDFVCPQCHGKLETQRNDYLYCRHCARIYFRFQSIPLLDTQYSPYVTDL